MPKGYAIPRHRKGLLSWTRAATRLARSRNYWVVTAQRNGRPHAVPVWGVWVDGAVCFGTDRGSRKARNIAATGRYSLTVDKDTIPVQGHHRQRPCRGRRE